MTEPNDELAEAAALWAAAGIPTVPIRGDGSRAPTVKNWPNLPVLDPEIARLTYRHHAGLAVICGNPHKIEMMELEGRAVERDLVSALTHLCVDHQLGPLLERITQGYLESSPRGGLHLIYRLSDGDAKPNRVLARDPDKQVLIETRGHGGYVIVAPTPGICHPNGKPWVLINGGPDTIATITADERDALHAIARLLDETPAPIDPEPHSAPRGPHSGAVRPGDDYNERVTWAAILTPHGWTRHGTLGMGETWRRPGKRHVGISATTGMRGTGAEDRLWVFSTNAAPFDTDKPYSKFAAYTLLNHRGDYAAASRQLRADGYGAERSTPARAPRTAHHLTAVDGSSALAPELDSAPQPAATGHNHIEAAAQFVTENEGLLRHVSDERRWLWWTGSTWARQPSNTGQIFEQLKAYGLALPADEKPDAKWRDVVLSTTGAQRIIQAAETDPRVALTRAELDTDPYLLGTPGGTVDLRTDELHAANPDQLITHSAHVTPDTAQPAPRWHQFLAETFGQPSTIGFVQRLIGLAAIGEVRENILPVLVGSGGNGKSVLVEVITRIMGPYAAAAPAAFLMATKFPAHETEIARMAGKRYVFASEVDDGARFDEAKVKRLTGGDTITARFMRQDHFEFTPSHTIFVVGNVTPNVSMGGRSFWRRVIIINFPNEVPAEKIDTSLVTRLVTDEGPAILQWIIDGARDYLANGLGIPADIAAATQEYVNSSDALNDFAETRCLISKGSPDRVAVRDLRAAYEAHCSELGSEPMSARSLGIELGRRYGVLTKQAHGVRYYVGLTLLATGGDDQGAPDEPSDRGWYP